LNRPDDGGGNDERLLSWAPDFTYEAGETVRRQLAALGIELIEAEESDA
jgi:hypothetical protein